MRLGWCWQVVKRVVTLLNRCEIQIAGLLIQIADDRGVGVRHHVAFSLAVATLTCVLLSHSFAHQVIVVNFQHSALVSRMKRVLEVFSDLFLVELLLNTVDNRHDSFDVLVKNVALLKTLKSNLTLLVWNSFLGFDNWQALISDVVHHRRRSFIRRNIGRLGLPRANLGQVRVYMSGGLSRKTSAAHESLFGPMCGVTSLNGASALEPLRFGCVVCRSPHDFWIWQSLMTTRSDHNVLAFGRRPQVAHSRYVVFDWSHRRLNFQIWLEPLHSAHLCRRLFRISLRVIVHAAVQGLLWTIEALWRLVPHSSCDSDFGRWTQSLANLFSNAREATLVVLFLVRHELVTSSAFHSLRHRLPSVFICTAHYFLLSLGQRSRRINNLRRLLSVNFVHSFLILQFITDRIDLKNISHQI